MFEENPASRQAPVQELRLRSQALSAQAGALIHSTDLIQQYMALNYQLVSALDSATKENEKLRLELASRGPVKLEAGRTGETPQTPQPAAQRQ